MKKAMHIAKRLLLKMGLDPSILHIKKPWKKLNIPDEQLYLPFFSPWYGDGEFSQYYQHAREKTLASTKRCYTLYALAANAIGSVEGDIWECGVYKGGTAKLLASLVADSKSDKKLFLFDTFEGMPETNRLFDFHKRGDFSDTSIEAVKEFIGHHEICRFFPGYIPDSFAGLVDSTIALAHIDLDIYQSIKDCVEFVWPRLSPGGVIVFDDYGSPTCPGARRAVDETLQSFSAMPLALSTGQAIVIKGGPESPSTTGAAPAKQSRQF